MTEKEEKFLKQYSQVNGDEHAKRALKIINDNNIEIPYGTDKEVNHIIDSVNAINLYNLIKCSEQQLGIQKSTLDELFQNSKKQKRQFIIATCIAATALIISVINMCWMIYAAS